MGARQPVAIKPLKTKNDKNASRSPNEAPQVYNTPLVHQRQESEGVEEGAKKQVLLCVHKSRRRRGTESRPAMLVFTFLFARPVGVRVRVRVEMGTGGGFDGICGM